MRTILFILCLFGLLHATEAAKQTCLEPATGKVLLQSDSKKIQKSLHVSAQKSHVAMSGTTMAALVFGIAIIAPLTVGFFLPRMRLTLLRLLIAEALPFYIFYAAFLDALTGVWAFCYSWTMSKNEAYNPGEVDYYVINDMWSAIFVFSTSFQGTIVTLENNHAGFVNLGCITIAFGGIAYQAYNVISAGGADVHSGGYFKAALQSSKSNGYKVVAALMFTYLVITFLDCFYVHGFLDFFQQQNRILLEDFLFYKVSPVAIVLGNAICLASALETVIEYEHVDLPTVRFKWSIFDTIVMPSSIFLKKLETAVVQAHCGHTENLKVMLEKPEMLREVLDMCPLRKPELADDSVMGTISELMG